ncbi:MAG: hypothetical protein IPK67_01760 [Planctomycetes bacterium]|nr:hypothetical protein [Planctomycetota bacterium]
MSFSARTLFAAGFAILAACGCRAASSIRDSDAGDIIDADDLPRIEVVGAGAAVADPSAVQAAVALSVKEAKEQARLDEEAAAQAQREAAEAERVQASEEASRRVASDVANRFPINFSQARRVRKGKSYWVGFENGVVSSNGRIDAVAVVETKEALAGFRGSATLRLKDERGNVLWQKTAPRLAVDGVIVPSRAPSRMTRLVQWTVPR